MAINRRGFLKASAATVAVGPQKAFAAALPAIQQTGTTLGSAAAAGVAPDALRRSQDILHGFMSPFGADCTVPKIRQFLSFIGHLHVFGIAEKETDQHFSELDDYNTINILINFLTGLQRVPGAIQKLCVEDLEEDSLFVSEIKGRIKTYGQKEIALQAKRHKRMADNPHQYRNLPPFVPPTIDKMIEQEMQDIRLLRKAMRHFGCKAGETFEAFFREKFQPAIRRKLPSLFDDYIKTNPHPCAVNRFAQMLERGRNEHLLPPAAKAICEKFQAEEKAIRDKYYTQQMEHQKRYTLRDARFYPLPSKNGMYRFLVTTSHNQNSLSAEILVGFFKGFGSKVEWSMRPDGVGFLIETKHGSVAEVVRYLYETKPGKPKLAYFDPPRCRAEPG